MDYIELYCKIESKECQAISEILVAELNEIGYESFDDATEAIKAYIPENLFDINKVRDLQINTLDNCTIDYSWNKIKSQNWNELWEKNFEPIIIEDQCIIKAPFHHDVPNFKFEIIIEPKMSFGTGHHETTYLMLKTMLDMDFMGKNILDMGCGTGVLAILASLKGAKEITAIDIDDWAYNNTIENIEKNSCKNIKVFQGDANLLIDQQYDIVIANINRNILLNDIKHYTKVLKSSGTLLLSGIYNIDLLMIKEEAAENNLKFISVLEKNNWVAAKFQKQ